MRIDMKSIGLAATIAFSLSASVAAGQLGPVQTPTFRSAEEAAAWAQGQLDADARSGNDSRQQRLFAVVSAFRRARTWKDVSATLQADAALGEAEAFLRLQSPKSALQAIDAVPRDTMLSSGRMARAKERAGEIGEMLGSAANAHETYEDGLRWAKDDTDPSWRTLLLYRSGVLGMALGLNEIAAQRLEEVAPFIETASLRGVAVRAALARCYARLSDFDRADVWATQAQRSLTRLTGDGGTGMPRTYVAEPTENQITKHIEETTAMRRR
jgi:tetratricopeptide (TPR) repeat protein